jgi:hypothetical protein
MRRADAGGNLSPLLNQAFKSAGKFGHSGS